MGKRLDAFLRKGFKTSKFKATANLAVSRLAVLKNQRQARCSIAKSDVVEFLKVHNQERAILRVEQVIKEQNMLDAFDLLEGYCHLLLERVNLLEHEKVCPEELKEAVSTIIYAATRCGDFPELQEIRTIFTSRFGKEFAARAVELRNNCGVNPKMIQKLSTRMPNLEIKMAVLKQIASDNSIDLPTVTESDEKLETHDTSHGSKPTRTEGIEEEEINISDSTKLRRKYKDVADAAQAAFESAAYAARAARAAVELSRSESKDPDDDQSQRNNSDFITTIDDEQSHHRVEIREAKSHKEVIKRTGSSSSSGSDENDDGYRVKENREHSNIEEREVVFDDEDGGGGGGEDLKEHYFPLRSENVEPLNLNRRPISVRSRWTQAR